MSKGIGVWGMGVSSRSMNDGSRSRNRKDKLWMVSGKFMAIVIRNGKERVYLSGDKIIFSI